jgi:hypothetical protein
VSPPSAPVKHAQRRCPSHSSAARVPVTRHELAVSPSLSSMPNAGAPPHHVAPEDCPTTRAPGTTCEFLLFIKLCRICSGQVLNTWFNVITCTYILFYGQTQLNMVNQYCSSIIVFLVHGLGNHNSNSEGIF